jgi:hypothetical protein
MTLAAVYARKSTAPMRRSPSRGNGGASTRAPTCRRTIGSAADCQVIAGPPADLGLVCK